MNERDKQQSEKLSGSGSVRISIEKIHLTSSWRFEVLLVLGTLTAIVAWLLLGRAGPP